MNLTTVATSVLQQMDGSNLPEAFLRGELNEAETNEVHKRPRLSSASPHPHTPHDSVVMDERETMNATSTHNGETARPAAGTLAGTAPGSAGPANAVSEHDLPPNRKSYQVPGNGKKRYNYWTAEQETTFMTAMEDIGGMDWPLIISRYGEGGTVNETLRGRDKMSLYNKAGHIKKKLVDAGKTVPAYLKDAPAKSLKKRARHEYADQDPDEDEGDGARRPKSRTRRFAPRKDQDNKVKWEAIELSDSDGDSDELKLEDAAPKKTPKAQQPRQKHGAAKDGADRNDYQMMELQLRQARATREGLRRSGRRRGSSSRCSR